MAATFRPGWGRRWPASVLRPLAVAGLICLAQLVAAAPMSSQSFQLIGQTTVIGAGQSASSAFGLQSCVDTAPTGSGTSASFRLQSGCITVLQAASNALPPIPPVAPGPPAVPVSVGGQWAWLLLTLALLAAAPRYVRARQSRVA